MFLILNLKKMDNNTFWFFIGLAAAALTTFSFLPQIFKVLQHKSVKDVSVITLFQFSLGVILWAIYGMYLKNSIIIIANLVSLFTLIILLFLYFKFRVNS